MARYCGGDNPEYLFQAIQHWKLSCIENKRSVFANKRIWNKPTAQKLSQRLIDAPLIGGEDDFYEKLEKQLKPLPAKCSILAAEMLWVLSLFSHNVGANEKRKSICFVYALSNEKLDQGNSYLSDEFLHGIASTGRAYSQYRWRELRYFAALIAKLFSEPEKAQLSLLRNCSNLSLWLESIDENESRQFRHMLLYALFPDENERIFSRTHRIRVLSQLGLNELRFNQISARLIDEEMLAVRNYYEGVFPEESLDFYVEPLSKLWDQKQKIGTHTKRSKNVNFPIKAINVADCWEDPPERTVAEQRERTYQAKGKYNRNQHKEAQNKALGRQGEKFVLALEKQKLIEAGHSELANKVKWTSEDEGDGTGYDIASFDEKKKTKLFIEVKTTIHRKSTPFFISPNELDFSKEHPDQYVLYRVFNFGVDSKIFKLTGDLSEQLHFDPTGYRVFF